MIKNKIAKSRILNAVLAAVVSLSMFITGMSMYVSADGEGATTPVTNKIKLTMEYMGNGNSPLDSGSTSASLGAAEEKIWLGIGAVSVEDGLKMSDTDLKLFTSGIYSLEISFAYDSDYIEPYVNATAGTTWQDELTAANLGSSNSSTQWSSDYSIVSSTDGDVIIHSSQTESIAVSGTNWRMCSVNMKFTGSDITAARFHNFSNDDDYTTQYFLRMPFKLKDIPASGTAEVLKLIQGPETFNIGSGAIGDEIESHWLAADSGTSYTNLKNVFDYKGNIRLFTDGSSISGIEVREVKYELNDDEEQVESYDNRANMYHSDSFSGDEGFVVERDTYYVRVKNEVDKVRILVNASDAVTINGKSAAAYEGADANYYADIALEPFNSDALTASDGYNVVNINDNYIIYIMRLLEPTIKLNYGNSPFGAIMADNNITDKDTAKAKFIANVNQFDAAYLPAGYSTSITYTPEAWVGPFTKANGIPIDPNIAAKIADPEINLDRNETVIFAYERTAFVDTGFSVKDSFGKDVAAADVTRTISGIYRLDNFKINTDISQQMPGYSITIPGTSNDLSAITADSPDVKGALVRPGVYELKYSYYDEVLDDTVTLEPARKIVVIPNIGDADMQDGVTTSDPVDIYAHAKNIKKIIDTTIAGDIENLFLYRVCDVDMQDGVTTSDPVDIYAHAKNIKYMTEFYQVTK